MFSALTIAKNNGSFQRSGQCLDRLIPRVQAAVVCRDWSCRQADEWRGSGAWASGQATERPQITSGKLP